jgi:hypothetical protein
VTPGSSRPSSMEALDAHPMPIPRPQPGTSLGWPLRPSLLSLLNPHPLGRMTRLLTLAALAMLLVSAAPAMPSSGATGASPAIASLSRSVPVPPALLTPPGQGPALLSPQSQAHPRPPATTPPQTVAQAQAWVRSELRHRYGRKWQAQWAAFDSVIRGESKWNPAAVNKHGSGACGLIQANPCSKMGIDASRPVDQARWALAYMERRYHSPVGCRAFRSAHGWV